MASKQTYQDRFIIAVKQFLVDKDAGDAKDEADIIGIPYQTYIKLMKRLQPPTLDHCLLVCKKARLSANWLFLGIGEPKLEYQATLNEIHKAVHKP